MLKASNRSPLNIGNQARLRKESMHHAEPLIEILVLLAVVLVIVPLFRTLKASPILGYLAGGLLIGPGLLNLLPEREVMAILAEFGVVFLLFTIGLELPVRRLRVMRKLVFGLGLAQVVLTACLFGGIAWLITGLPRASVVIGIGLALSSTAMVVQILMERGEIYSKPGRMSFSILLFQDLAVVPALALVPLLADPGHGLVIEELLTALAEAAAALAGILLLGRFIIRPILRFLSAQDLPEVLTAAALFVAIGAATLTGAVGMSMALGAFLAGLLLAESEFRNQMEADIQPFRNLLLGLFFTTVGMGIDLGALAAGWDKVLLLLVALLGLKTATIWGLCRLAGSPNSVSLQTGMSLAQGGEFAFVLFGLAGGSGLLPAEIMQILMPAIALSMALTPFLMIGAEKLAHRMEGREQQGDTGSSLPPGDDSGASGGEEEKPVLILGYGRVGQTVATILERQNLPWQALDLAPKRVAAARRLGQPVFFGSAARPEILRASGLRKAAAVVITLDKDDAVEASLQAVRAIAPGVPVFIRARDHIHVRLLLAGGASDAVADTLEASLQLGGMVLRSMDRPDAEIAACISSMRHYAGEMIRDLIPEFPDSEDKEKL